MGDAMLLYPSLPLQFLLTNFLAALPGTTIATDTVDAERVRRPGVWDIHLSRDVMVIFGPFSPLAEPPGFAALLAFLFVALGMSTAGYVVAADLARRRFHQRAVGHDAGPTRSGGQSMPTGRDGDGHRVRGNPSTPRRTSMVATST